MVLVHDGGLAALGRPAWKKSRFDEGPNLCQLVGLRIQLDEDKDAHVVTLVDWLAIISLARSSRGISELNTGRSPHLVEQRQPIVGMPALDDLGIDDPQDFNGLELKPASRRLDVPVATLVSPGAHQTQHDKVALGDYLLGPAMHIGYEPQHVLCVRLVVRRSRASIAVVMAHVVFGVEFVDQLKPPLVPNFLYPTECKIFVRLGHTCSPPDCVLAIRASKLPLPSPSGLLTAV
jgi:hypothetical protein